MRTIKNTPINREETTDLSFTVSCWDGKYHEQINVRVNIADANDEPPVFDQPIYNFSIFENNPIGNSFIN